MPRRQDSGESPPPARACGYPQMSRMRMNAQTLSSASPTLPAESQLLQAECVALFLGLNFFKLELNQVGRKSWDTRDRAAVFLRKFNYNFRLEPGGLGLQLSWCLFSRRETLGSIPQTE